MSQPKQSSAQLNKELRSLYKKWPDIKRFLVSIGCPSKESEDIFQEALLIYVRKKETPDFELDVEPFHYIKNTCKYLWYNLSRKKDFQPIAEIVSLSDQGIDRDWIKKEARFNQLETALKNIGDKCQQLLELFYSKQWSMVDIAAKLGFRNDKVAKAQKYRCLNKVKDQVAKLPEHHQSLTYLNEQA